MFHNMYMLVNHLLTLFIVFAPMVYFLLLVKLLWPHIKASWLPIATYLFLTAIFLNKLLFFDQTLAQKDFNDLQIPLAAFLNKSITQNFMPPLIDMAFCGGYNAFANPLSGYFSMFSWLFLVVSNVYQAYNLYLFVQIFLCAVFTYVALRMFGFSKTAAFTGGILYTFNAFVTMRLSPGVGVEYLFAYKWLPLILALTKQRKYLGLAIALAFSLEGNPNMVIAIGVLWLVFLLVNYKEVVQEKFKILLAPVIAFCIYAIKIIPAADYFFGDDNRFTQEVGGWRGANFDLDMFPKPFLPIKFDFNNGYFTPGLIGVVLATIGLILMLKGIKTKNKDHYFSLSTFVLAFLLTIENPFYSVFYALPILNRLTQIPSMLIFYILPLTFFAAHAIQHLQKHLPKLIVLIPSLAMFAEVWLGPSLFGTESYSFNFAKMPYKTEPYQFRHYQELNKLPQGSFWIEGNQQVFIYPYAVAVNKLKTLNTPRYYYGCQKRTELPREYTDYVLSDKPLTETNLKLVTTVSMSNIKNFSAHSVFERLGDYGKLVQGGWNDDLHIYTTKCEENCVTKVTYLPENWLKSEKETSTNISYSKWWTVNTEKGPVALAKDANGFVKLPVGTLYYINFLVLAGWVISLYTLFAILKLNKR